MNSFFLRLSVTNVCRWPFLLAPVVHEYVPTFFPFSHLILLLLYECPMLPPHSPLPRNIPRPGTNPRRLLRNIPRPGTNPRRPLRNVPRPGTFLGSPLLPKSRALLVSQKPVLVMVRTTRKQPFTVYVCLPVCYRVGEGLLGIPCEVVSFFFI